MHLIAEKRLTYAGRVHRPGATFEAKPAHARLLMASGVARQAPAKVLADGGMTVRSLDALRADYETKFGRAADLRWGAKRLQKELAAP